MRDKKKSGEWGVGGGSVVRFVNLQNLEKNSIHPLVISGQQVRLPGLMLYSLIQRETLVLNRSPPE